MWSVVTFSSLSILKGSSILQNSVPHSFLVPNNIPFYEYTTLFIHSSVTAHLDYLYTFILLLQMLLWIFHTNFLSGHLFSFLLGVKLLDHNGNFYFTCILADLLTSVFSDDFEGVLKSSVFIFLKWFTFIAIVSCFWWIPFFVTKDTPCVKKYQTTLMNYLFFLHTMVYITSHPLALCCEGG